MERFFAYLQLIRLNWVAIEINVDNMSIGQSGSVQTVTICTRSHIITSTTRKWENMSIDLTQIFFFVHIQIDFIDISIHIRGNWQVSSLRVQISVPGQTVRNSQLTLVGIFPQVRHHTMNGSSARVDSFYPWSALVCNMSTFWQVQ